MADSLPALVIEPEQAANASIIWLHGLGADGHDFESIVPHLALKDGCNARFIFPHAPSIPISMNQGYVMPAWFDVQALDGGGRNINSQQLLVSSLAVHKLIDMEIEKGINSERIILVGFSQGGAVNYQAGLTYDKPLAGLLSLSSFFPTAEEVIPHPANQKLPILVCHGTEDNVLDITLAEKSLAALKALGYQPKYLTYPMAHSVCPQQITDISSWLNAQL
ncbi:MAG: carboxylesterase [SAR86 cluster bacterium]|uniref:Carboxylesterase n=1 Tax=SAR86 cluster bacterium TaxID=2030880 RepID=A0A2A5CJA7_9GAMM|nr:dienelactone hydrolase family protein [Gammaproteobacteria bacterium AH-315-E17]PCJ43456.1 MAG: carboxylesterase [SAR86 cluster bacterium]